MGPWVGGHFLLESEPSAHTIVLQHVFHRYGRGCHQHLDVGGLSLVEFVVTRPIYLEHDLLGIVADRDRVGLFPSDNRGAGAVCLGKPGATQLCGAQVGGHEVVFDLRDPCRHQGPPGSCALFRVRLEALHLQNLHRQVSVKEAGRAILQPGLEGPHR